MGVVLRLARHANDERVEGLPTVRQLKKFVLRVITHFTKGFIFFILYMSDYSLLSRGGRKAMTANPCIQVERVSKRFGKKVVIDDVSLEVQTGEIFGLLGPSGAGKTTLVRMIAGIDQASEFGAGKWALAT